MVKAAPGALRNAYDHEVAGWFVKEAAHPPTEDLKMEEFRAKWLPWLTETAPGPVEPRPDSPWDKDWSAAHD